MLIAFIIILLLGFINSKFWLLFVFLAAYFLLTMDSRSKKAVERRLFQMFMSRKMEHHYKELFFEAADKYARTYGINYSRGSENVASCFVIFKGVEYMVFFTRVDKILGGGTYFSIYDDNKNS